MELPRPKFKTKLVTRGVYKIAFSVILLAVAAWSAVDWRSILVCETELCHNRNAQRWCSSSNIHVMIVPAGTPQLI